MDEGIHVGFAIYSPQLNLHYMFKFSSYATVFTAEAWAIYNALSIALHKNLTSYYLNCLWSNHFNLNHSLFRKNLINDPSCSCGTPCQDLVHTIYNCPITENHAYPLHKALLSRLHA
ncbi:hypothetical protein ALC57_00624 [Trachymyrmex cornetzi]|uniref:RNase H type-1 domain-containing protein n=1 Tax=Trachymyrmex cornetzi TaxID=471704 RepID=A0A151JRC3_9HYME|nr:hypothetical protein ALC57_00624 [Trachymyrmex cornetzi]